MVGEMVVVVVVRIFEFESEFKGRWIMYAPEPCGVKWGDSSAGIPSTETSSIP
jgi:hypothetical protein